MSRFQPRAPPVLPCLQISLQIFLTSVAERRRVRAWCLDAAPPHPSPFYAV